jgi:DNA-binding NarL/FixJ family response regulator
VSEALKIVAVDDNRLALSALERWLTTSDNFEWLGGVSTPTELFALLKRGEPELMLLDVDMPGVDTFALLAEIATLYPRIKVVMFSGYVRDDYVERALAAGASGYVIKDEPMATTVDLLHRAARGECVLSEAAATAFMQGGGTQRPREVVPSAETNTLKTR